jgi:hypothetical protein
LLFHFRVVPSDGFKALAGFSNPPPLAKPGTEPGAYAEVENAATSRLMGKISSALNIGAAGGRGGTSRKIPLSAEEQRVFRVSPAT